MTSFHVALSGHPAAALAWAVLLVANAASPAAAEEAPPELFKKLDHQIAGEAIVLNGKQLFIDDLIIQELDGARKVLNQPAKHPDNPLLVPDLPWEKNGYYANGSVSYDEQEKQFKIWYHVWRHPTAEAEVERLCGYATSADGIAWTKPSVNRDEGNNVVLAPQRPGFCGQGIFKDPAEHDPERRYKMLYNEMPDGTESSWSTGAAYSPDGIRWAHDPQNPLIPMSDTQSSVYWDTDRRHYVAFIRTGPPNVRGIARIESEDFVHWSPKVTVFDQGELAIDGPYDTKLYGMQILPYERSYIGLINAYHGETTQPIPADQLWRDKLNVQLSFSRNGILWQRVGPWGAISPAQYKQDLDWKAVCDGATFIPYGRHQEEWDWGQLYPYHAPLVVGDEIRIYYTGIAARHFATYHGDDFPPASGIGLATLRLDGFVSVEAEGEGTVTTRPLIFIGDELEVNADASAGSITVEALDVDGQPLPGFTRADCQPLTSDDVHHTVVWNGVPDCYPLQARPIQLRFHLNGAKLYSFTPRIKHKHFVKWR